MESRPAKLVPLKRNFEFARAYKSKKCFVSPFVVTYVVVRKSGGIRVGVTASKKIGCAVQRNRARRVIKAAASELLRNADGCFDVVFVARKAALDKKSTELRGVIAKQLTNAGITLR